MLDCKYQETFTPAVMHSDCMQDMNSEFDLEGLFRLAQMRRSD